MLELFNNKFILIIDRVGITIVLGHWRAWRGWWISQRCSSWTFWEFGTTFVWKPLLQVHFCCRYRHIAFFILRDLLHGFFCGMLTYIFSFYHLFGSRLGLMESTLSSGSSASRKSLQSRLLCFVVTAIAKLATHHRDLLPRARVSLAKVSLVILHNHLIQKLFWWWFLLKKRIDDE